MKFNLRLPGEEKHLLLEHAKARNTTPTAVLREYIRTLPDTDNGKCIASKEDLKLTRIYSITYIDDSQQKRNYGDWFFNGWDEDYLLFWHDGVELLLPRLDAEAFEKHWKIKEVNGEAE